MTLPASALRCFPHRAVAAMAALAACAMAPGCELPEIPVGICGNRVVEPALGEACDGEPVDSRLDCGSPDTADACQFICDGATEYGFTPCCPAGQACGLDGRCRQPTGRFESEGVRLGAGAEELVSGDLDGDRRMDLVRLLNVELGVVFGAARGSVPVEHRQTFEPLFLPAIVKRSAAEDQGDEDARAGNLQPSNLLVSRFGAAVFQAGAAQSLLPISQAALPVPAQITELAMMALRVGNRVHSSKLLWHLEGELYGQRVSLLAHMSETEPIILAPTDGPPSELAAEPVIAQLDERPTSICDDVVLGYAGRSKLELFNPFVFVPDDSDEDDINENNCEGGLYNCPEDMPRRLDIEAPLRRGPFAVDLNRDGHLDLVVQVEHANPNEQDCSPDNDPCLVTRVSYGVGNGTFHSDPATLPLFDPSAPTGGESGDNRFGAAPTVVVEGDPILALGDLDGNGLPDAVTDRRITLSFETPAGTWSRESVAANSGERWTEAVIADFNDNGWLDVAATDGGSKRIQFFNGAGSGTLNPYNIELDAPLAQLHAGDFDGDTLFDLLGVARVVNAQGVAGDELTVLFGSPAGRPEPPVTLGRTDHDFEIRTAPFATDIVSVVRNVEDGIDDVVAMASKGGVVRSAHVFAGRSDRDIRSPLGFVAGFADDIFEADFEPHLARKLVTGHFAALGPDDDPSDPRGEQLAVLARAALDARQPYQLWVVPEIDEEFGPRSMQEVAEPIEAPMAPSEESPPDPVAIWELGLYAAIDIDRDGVDELLALAPLWADRNRAAYRIATLTSGGWQWRPADGPALLDLPLYRYAGPTTPCRDPVSYPELGASQCEGIDTQRMLATAFASPDENGRVRRCRLDGNGGLADALVLITVRPPCTEEELAQASCPSLAEREPRLLVYQFDGELQLERERFVEIPLPDDGSPLDVDCLEVDGLPGQELVVVTSAGARLVYGPATAKPSVGDVVSGTSGYLRVAAGDVDGDGLDDLVLGSRDETSVFYAVGRTGAAGSGP